MLNSLQTTQFWKYKYQQYYPKIATSIEEKFDRVLMENVIEKFKSTNKQFYDYIKKDRQVSRIKIYLSRVLSDYRIKKRYV